MDGPEGSKKLTALLDQMGMTPIEFSDFTGIPYRTIQGWRSGKRQVKPYLLRMMERIAELEKENDSLKKKPADKVFIAEYPISSKETLAAAAASRLECYELLYERYMELGEREDSALPGMSIYDFRMQAKEAEEYTLGECVIKSRD